VKKKLGKKETKKGRGSSERGKGQIKKSSKQTKVGVWGRESSQELKRLPKKKNSIPARVKHIPKERGDAKVEKGKSRRKSSFLDWGWKARKRWGENQTKPSSTVRRDAFREKKTKNGLLLSVKRIRITKE